MGSRAQALPGLFLADGTDFSFEGLANLGINQEIVVLASIAFSTFSLAVNFLGGVETEKKRAELQLELEREKAQQTQLAEIRRVIERYRGPLLESAIDLEQPLWHLVAEGQGRELGREDACSKASETVRYLLFTIAQFLGYFEVMRREGPRERSFLQAGNFQGSDTLQTLLEGVRFVLCSSNEGLERWYNQGSTRPHPGARNRQPREAIIAAARAAQSNGASSSLAAARPELFRISRGTQRAIGSLMITTPQGAERHYTLSYAEFCRRLETEPSFAVWFKQIEADVRELMTGDAWAGERPFEGFVAGRWTRVLLLQQLLVEVFDLLDPDLVRLPMARRMRLMPVRWGPLPNIEQYTRQLKELSEMHWDLFGRGRQENPLEGLRDLLLSVTVDEGDQAVPAGTAPHSNGNGSSGGSAAGPPGSVAQRSVLSSSSGSFSEERP
ncbi:hypothetical protein C2E21_8600 [Chlorella sorokiniana]|uniref:Uncharacterized protein n=1 Tax=Chlorella sorokiniana TaxID=3076 RepID=A0A2P6TE64_CHLSO|nr:hypothetical protein C2E21_8600 [Chlorella sorokiniana]|eukprot:PRW20927.1 hypothetical protein C2E21_8600 [Chlorella sorokiniana]